MGSTILRVGLTRTERDTTGYIPMADGWRPGARAWRYTIRVNLPRVDDPQTIAEAVFVATNGPQSVINADPVALPIHEAIAARQMQACSRLDHTPSLTDRTLTDHMRSLSVGDTVTIDLHADGRHVRTYACDHTGWLDVTDQLQPGAASARRMT
jgi:hypothetical protein